MKSVKVERPGSAPCYVIFRPEVEDQADVFRVALDTFPDATSFSVTDRIRPEQSHGETQ